MVTVNRRRKRSLAARRLAAGIILSLVVLGASVVFRGPAGSQWRGRKMLLWVQPLPPGAYAGDGFWIHHSWSAPRGWPHGSIHGIRLGNKLLRLDVTYDPIAAIKRDLPKSLPGLLAALNTRDSLVLQCVLEALITLGPEAKAGLPVLLQRYGRGDENAGSMLTELAKAVGPEAVPMLVEALTNQDALIEAKAIETLGEMGTNALAAVPNLSCLLSNSFPSNTLAAALSLRKIAHGNHGEVEALLRLLHDPDPQVQAAAIFVLGEFGEDAGPAANPLLALLEQARPDLEGWAARSFGLMGPAGRIAIPHLVAQLHETNPTNTFFIMEALGMFGEYAAPAIPSLCAIAEDADQSQYRLMAIAALSKIGTNAIPCLLRLYHTEKPDFVSLSKALIALGPGASAAVPDLLKELNSENPYRAAAAAIALGSIGPQASQTVPILANLVSDENEQLRLRAAEALWKIARQTNTVLPVMIRELTEWSHSPSALIGNATDSYFESRQQIAARIIGEIGPVARHVAPLLRMMQRSTFEEQRAAATEALKKIASTD